MPLTDAQKRAQYKYKAAKQKRIPLDVQKGEYMQIAAAAAQAGESVNGYIKKAVRARMMKEGAQAAPEDAPPI